MKTENFDDAIRRKIENINPQYDEKDIDRTMDYVSRKRAETSRRRYGAIVLALLAGLMMVGLLTWNLSEQKNQKQLTETIDSLKSKLAQAEKPASTTKDTVYVTKYITQSNADKQIEVNRIKNETGNSFLASKENVPKKIIADHSASVVIARNDGSASRSVREAIPLNKKITTTATKNNQFANSKTSLSQNESNDVDKSSSENSVAVKQTQDSESNIIGNENNTDKKNTVENNAEMVSSKDPQTNADRKEPIAESALLFSLKQEIASQENRDAEPSSGTPRNEAAVITKHDSSVALTPELSGQNKPSDTLSVDKKKNHQPLFSFLKKWYYQAGIGYAMADGLRAYSITGEAYFKRNWSVSLGIRLAKVDNENYDNDNDFHNKKGKHFYEAYSSESLDTSAYSHIEIHTTLLQIPVMLNYHIALSASGGLQLLIGAGTDIDLVAKQHVGCHRIENNNMETLKNFDANPPAILFNNAELTAGIQGQWKHFVAQAAPFISQQLISVPYKKNDLVFGGGARVLYAF